jgi:urease accessory protein
MEVKSTNSDHDELLEDSTFKPGSKTINGVGKRGSIFLKLECNGNTKVKDDRRTSRTFIKDLRTSAPFLVQRALYPDATLPHMAHVYLMSSAGSILEGDRFNIAIEAGPGTCSWISTQAATKIHKMMNGYATQNIDINLGKNAYLEFVPEMVIPYKSSKYFQEVTISPSDGSLMVYAETFCSGRVASREAFDFDICSFKTFILDHSAKPIITDSMKLSLSGSKDEILYQFDNKNFLFTAYVIVGEQNYGNVAEEIRKCLLTDDYKILSGFSRLPGGSGYVVKILAESMDKVNGIKDSLIGATRKLYLTGLS